MLWSPLLGGCPFSSILLFSPLLGCWGGTPSSLAVKHNLPPAPAPQLLARRCWTPIRGADPPRPGGCCAREGAGWELVGRYEKDRDPLLRHLCACEVLLSPALPSLGSFPAAGFKFCNPRGGCGEGRPL